MSPTIDPKEKDIVFVERFTHPSSLFFRKTTSRKYEVGDVVTV